jgi:hypothetical protein
MSQTIGMINNCSGHKFNIIIIILDTILIADFNGKITQQNRVWRITMKENANIYFETK